MACILICCRRKSRHCANQLGQALTDHFGSDCISSPVFLDGDGTGIIEKNQRSMAACDLLLLVVDSNWFSDDPGGDQWFHQATDPVRLLIADALIREVRLVTIVIDSATLPREQDLPDDLKSLVHHQSLSIRGARWDHDVFSLIKQLELVVKSRETRVAAASMRRSLPVQNSGFSRVKAASSRFLNSLIGGLFSTSPKKEVPRMQERGGASADDVAFEPQVVHLGASAPSAIQPGNEFTARFVAYLKEAEIHLEEVLRRLSPRSTSRLDIKRCQWQPGIMVTVALSGRWLEVEEAEQTFVWEGPHTILDFDVFLNPDAPQGTTILKFNVSIEGIRVAKLRMDLQVTNTSRSDQPITVTTEAARTAFASYSSQDRQRVLDRLASVRISAGLEVFLDCLSLRPGEEWKPRIAKEIRSRDQFLLFWSQAASRSEWVTWEWQTALDEKGKPEMQVHPLENNVPPPAKLSNLHFGDVFIAIRDADAKSI